MTPARWALGRMLFALPVVLLITALTFTLIHVAPGDPIVLLAGDGGSPAYYQEMRQKFGLDRPMPEQFVRYARTALTGDFGYSFTFEAPVASVIVRRAGASLLLGTAALALAIVGGLLLAFVCLGGSRSADALVRSITALMYAAPVYWTGQLLIIGAAVELGWLPVGGMTSARDTHVGVRWALDVARHLVLPAVALSLPFMAVVTRVARASLIETLREPFVEAARARGLSPRQVLTRHALPHAAVALVTLVGQHAPQIVGGAAITEYLFGWPGLGSAVLHASLHRDYPMVTASFLLISIAVVVFNALADASCAWLDPRLRLT